MASPNSELRFSQLVSGSTSDLACVVSMLDDLLERSRRADLFPDSDSIRGPLAEESSSTNGQPIQDDTCEDQDNRSPSTATTFSSGDDQQPIQDLKKKSFIKEETWSSSRSSKVHSAGVNRPVSIESADSTSSGTSSESSHSRLNAWPSAVDVCPDQVNFTSLCRNGQEYSLKASCSSLSTEEATSSVGSAGATMKSDVSGCGVQCPYLQRVLSELVLTEKDYVESLNQIINGYMNHWKENPPKVFSEESCSALFGNLTDIFDCNSDFQAMLDKCDGDPVCVAESFVQHGERFSVYVQYCTSYPRAVSVLTELMASEVTAAPFRGRQKALGHALPLGSHLLKPVQRILKYHLLLQNIRRGLEMNGGDTTAVSAALVTMTTLAHHINSMKRRHEYAVRVQEIQSLLHGWQGADLTTLGELVAEGTFRMYRAKTSRHLFLFDRLLLITKRREDAALAYKTHILCSNLMLVESISGEPLCFHVIPFDNPRVQYTLQARNKEQKRAWTLQLKRVILESYNVVIPYHTRELVLKLGQEDDETDGECWHRQRSSRRYPVAAEYLERRHAIKASQSFSRRLGLRPRARSTDTANCEEGGSRVTDSENVPQPADGMCDSRHESCTRRSSAPSSPTAISRSVLRSQSSVGPLSGRLTSAATAGVPGEQSESLQSIVEQLVLQNVHKRRGSSHRPVKRSGPLHSPETSACNNTYCSVGTVPRTASIANPFLRKDTASEEQSETTSDAAHCRDSPSALIVQHYGDGQYISFSDYSAANSPLTRPQMFPTLKQAAAAMSGLVGGECGSALTDSRVSLHRTVSDPCRRMARSVSRQWPRHGDMSHLLTALRRRTSLRRSAALTHARTPNTTAGTHTASSSIKLPAYLTPQLGKRADRLAAQLVRRSGSLGRDSGSCAGEYSGEAATSCGSSLAGSCDSLTANQLPVCRFYGVHQMSSTGPLRQIMGSMRSRFTQRLKQRGAAGDGDPDVYGHHQQHAQQGSSRLMSVLARALKERSVHKSDSSGEMITECGLVNSSPLSRHHHHLRNHHQRPSSTLSESTSCSSTSSGVATEGSRARGSDGEISQDSCEQRQFRKLGDSGVTISMAANSSEATLRDSAVYSEPDCDGAASDFSVVVAADAPQDTGQQQQPFSTRTPSIRERLRSLHQSIRGANNTPDAEKNTESESVGSDPVSDLDRKCINRRCGGDQLVTLPSHERRQRVSERWHTRRSNGDDESETSSQHSTSTQNTVVDGAGGVVAATGWVRQVIGKLQGDTAAA